MRKLILVLAMLVGSVWGQAFYQLPRPYPGATLLVCPVGTQNPCPTPSAIFRDSGLTLPISQPVQLGPTGQFGFYVSNGQYTIQLTASDYSTSYIVSLGGSGGGVTGIAGGNPVKATNYFAEGAGPFLDVIAFGAVCDNVTDDRTAIQAAITAMEAQKGTLIFPAGKLCYSSDALTLLGGDNIRGGGAFNNQTGAGLRFGAGKGGFTTGSPTTYISSIHIEDLNLQNGLNPIDFGTANEVWIQRVHFLDYTGCGITLVDSERDVIEDIYGQNSGASGFALLCTGDKSKSLFSASIGAGPFGIVVSRITNLIEHGSEPGNNFNQYLWWAGQGVGGDVNQDTVRNLACEFGCRSGVFWTDDVVQSDFDLIVLDGVAKSGTPESIAINIAGSNALSNSHIRHFFPAFNGNFITTEMQLSGSSNSTISETRFDDGGSTNPRDNVTTFGLKITGFVYGTTLVDTMGAVFFSTAQTANAVQVIGGFINPSNFPAGAGTVTAQLLAGENSDMYLIMQHDHCCGGGALDTGLFRLHRNTAANTYVDDFTSNGTLFTLNEGIGFAHLAQSPTAPTITTHFNTSGDSISANNGTTAFTVTVGTGGGTSTGVLGLPTATTGWNCFAANMNRGAYIQQTASGTTSATLTNYGTTVGTPVNWTNSDVLHVSCFAY